ncbi:MAG: CBS domain-containing protein [Anaerolineae bacterium]|nr:CBS domain-containing protein [Anaerolineae bacterium]
MLVGRRMTPDPITVAPDLPIADALELMRQKKVRRFPVIDKKGKLIGIVTQNDLLYAAPSSVTSLNVWEVNYLLSKVTVKEVMTKDVITICHDCTIEEAAAKMREHKIGGLPVLDDGKLVGIITESDLFRVFLELFEAGEKGWRLTVLAPYFKGSLAQISTAITQAGGLILALNTFKGEDTSNWGCTLKVTDIGKDDLLKVVEPLVVQIVDVREA